MPLPPEIHTWLDQLREQGFILPPLEPPLCCARCQRPLEPEKRQYRTCWDCGHTHPPGLNRVAATTYGADGTAPWQILKEAKFQTLPADAVAQRVTVVAAGIWTTVEDMAPDFLDSTTKLAFAIPSRHNLVGRCAVEAAARGWPALPFVDGLRAENRPPQTDLGADARREAARDKYSVSVDLAGRDVLLIDDVYTSGYSMHDAARAVRAGGAASVTGVVYARRVYPDVMALYREIRDV